MKQVTALMLAATMIGCAAGAVEPPPPRVVYRLNS